MCIYIYVLVLSPSKGLEVFDSYLLVFIAGLGMNTNYLRS